ncbi:MAG TPA: hypothetical protein DCP31_24215, partial [Cyanobacteria bacterium UBA8543]|nr:hypothetical protein [Cyanobacteria bacterium UBA8543]
SGANLSSADLSLANLAGVNLVSANLTDTKILGANLVGAVGLPLPFLPAAETPVPRSAPDGGGTQRQRGGYEPSPGIGAPSGTQGPGTRGDSRKDKPRQ